LYQADYPYREYGVQRLRPLPVEAVVRGYMAGSAWAEYQAHQTVCQEPLPAGFDEPDGPFIDELG
jgi:phosphoribosylaminoimidazole-succinocarboxamide synthase